jgi:Leucine-rich repeat (LRR) protein
MRGYKREKAGATELYKNELSEFSEFDGDIRAWKEFHNSEFQKFLDREYPAEGNGREKTPILYIDKKGLGGGLRLKGFTNLRELFCSNNQLTNLDLSGCENLVRVHADNNSFRNLNFLRNVSSIENLSVINCHSLKGSLKPLKNLKKLRIIFIGGTDISEGLEYLPESCQKLYCNSDYRYKSIKIAEELDKSKCSE